MASASEKLRGLWMRVDQTQTIDDFDGAMIDFSEAMVDALPLIADVVEAAEKYAPSSWQHDDEWMRGPTLGRALDVLREHLEGSDPDVSERGSSAAVVDGAGYNAGHHETVGERQGRQPRSETVEAPHFDPQPPGLMVDGNGYVWRVYKDYYSLCPTRPEGDNDTITEPLTFYKPDIPDDSQTREHLEGSGDGE